MNLPESIFFVAGSGQGLEPALAYSAALAEAGIHLCNLVAGASVIPPACRFVEADRALLALAPGAIVHCLIERVETDEGGRRIAAGVGWARPSDGTHGYLAGAHGLDLTASQAGTRSEELAYALLMSTLGLEAADSTEIVPLRIIEKGPLVEPGRVAVEATGEAGVWTCALAAAVLVG